MKTTAKYAGLLWVNGWPSPDPDRDLVWFSSIKQAKEWLRVQMRDVYRWGAGYVADGRRATLHLYRGGYGELPDEALYVSARDAIRHERY